MAVGALRLDLGDIDLVSADGGYDSYWFNTLGEDADFGEPGPVDLALESLLADGSPVETTRWENREATFRVQIEAPDAAGLAEGEASLQAQVGVRTTLAWTPPDGFGPTTVFDVETSRLKYLFNDLDEVRSVCRRTFQLTLTCLPWARPEDPVTIGSEFVSDDIDIEDDCESTTGWSFFGGRDGVFSVDSTAGNFVTGTGSVKFVLDADRYPYTEPFFVGSGGVANTYAYVAKTGLSIDASGGGYLVLRVKGGWQEVQLQEVYVTTSSGGREAVDAAVIQAEDNGFVRYAFPTPNASTITGFDCRVQWSMAAPYGSQPPIPPVWFDSIGLADAATENQQVRTLAIAGAMRTEASFEISAPAGLGDVVLYTCPDRGDGYRPDLRRWQTAGTSTSDAAAVNGSYVAAGSGATFKAPASMYRPGAYAVLARIDDGGSITVTAQVELDGTLIGDVYTVTSPTVSVTDYTVIRVGVLDLPPWGVDPASGALVKFVLSGSAKVDEIMAFPLEDSALTWVSCGSGSPSATVASRLWLDEPSAQTGGRPRRYAGNDADRLDARYIRPVSAGRHLLKPGQNFAYLLSSASGGAALQVSYFPRYGNNNAYSPEPS